MILFSLNLRHYEVSKNCNFWHFCLSKYLLIIQWNSTEFLGLTKIPSQPSVTFHRILFVILEQFAFDQSEGVFYPSSFNLSNWMEDQREFGKKQKLIVNCKSGFWIFYLASFSSRKTSALRGQILMMITCCVHFGKQEIIYHMPRACVQRSLTGAD